MVKGGQGEGPVMVKGGPRGGSCYGKRRARGKSSGCFS
jgi:hypothetical protein